MNRLPGPGRDFDDQWSESRREGWKKSQRGEGPWANDKMLRDLARQQSLDASGADNSNTGGRHAKPSSDSCVTALGVLGGLAWAITETIRHLT